MSRGAGGGVKGIESRSFANAKRLEPWSDHSESGRAGRIGLLRVRRGEAQRIASRLPDGQQRAGEVNGIRPAEPVFLHQLPREIRCLPLNVDQVERTDSLLEVHEKRRRKYTFPAGTAEEG